MSQTATIQYFLVRNDHRLRCGRCNAVHPYVSVACLPCPMTARSEVVLLDHQQTHERGLVHGENVEVNEDALSAMRMGRLEPISQRDAEKLRLRIRLRGGKV